MQITTEIDEKRVETFIKNVMQNYPEASTPSLQSVRHEDGSWGYDKCEYLFDDAEEGEIDPDTKCGTAYSDDVERYVYVLKLEDLKRGFEIFVKMKLGGQLKGITLGMSPLFTPDNKLAWSDWEGDWDADALDCMVQCAIFGDVIYG